jgi:hypothetical protein
MSARHEAPMTQLALFPDPRPEQERPPEPPNPLAAMTERLAARLRASGLREVPLERPHARRPSVVFRIPLSSIAGRTGDRHRSLTDTELGRWWHGHVRYQISYEPFDDGRPGFTLIDRRDDTIVWARHEPHGVMMFPSWQAAVRAAIAHEANEAGAG